MPKPVATAFLYTLVVLHTHIALCSPTQVSHNSESNDDQYITATSVEEYLTAQDMMDSETSRRVMLMNKRYISYETLKRDIVPCTKPGASYYNCPTAQANPYSRGCEVISRCRGGIH